VVVAQQLAIILQADELPWLAAVRGEVREGIAERIDQRKNVEDDQENQRRDDEQVADGQIRPAARGGPGGRIKIGEGYRSQRMSP